MRRIGLAALTTLFATSGLALAGQDGLQDTQPDRGVPVETGTAPLTETKEGIVGNAGDTAALEQDEVKITPESSVEAADPEKMEDAGDTATIN